jgi:hypothetical protein
MKHKKMVTTFNKTDLKKFGQFIADEYCTDEREITSRDVSNFLVEKQFDAVRDFQNWKVEDFPEDKQDAFRELQPYLNELVMTDIMGTKEQREESRNKIKLEANGAF